MKKLIDGEWNLVTEKTGVFFNPKNSTLMIITNREVVMYCNKVTYEISDRVVYDFEHEVGSHKAIAVVNCKNLEYIGEF